MQTSIITMEDMKKRIQTTIKQTFLNQYIEAPVDEDKLFMLIAIMNDTKMPVNCKVQYILAATLIQTALDAHDLVPVKDDDLGDDFSVQDQLTVLAGDYYSGLYYFLLSEIDDYLMVKQLATAIKDINEEKMALLYGESEPVNMRIQRLKRIETLLITRVTEHIGSEHLACLAEQWVLAGILLKEKDNIDQHNKSKWFGDMDWDSGRFDHVSISTQLDHHFHSCIQYIKRNLPSRMQQDMRGQLCHSRLFDELYGQELNKEEG